MGHIKKTGFKVLARKQTSLQIKMRLLALAHFQDVNSRTQIAHAHDTKLMLNSPTASESHSWQK